MSGLNALCWVVAVCIAVYATLFMLKNILDVVIEWRVDILQARADNDLRRWWKRAKVMQRRSVLDLKARTVTLSLPASKDESHYLTPKYALERALDAAAEEVA
jgi:hypothetical protein